MKGLPGAPVQLTVWLAGDAETVLELLRSIDMNLVQHDLNSFVHICRVLERTPFPNNVPDYALVVPSVLTWSRLRHFSMSGQPPLRSAAWPWGLPTLTGEYREQVEATNGCVKHCLSVLGCARQRNASAELLLFHPEDFGSANTGVPASIWQLKEIKEFAVNLQLHRSALYQCRHGYAASPSPIAILSSSSHPVKGAVRGWPKFSDRRHSNYLGPLPKHCGCIQPHGAKTQRRTKTRSAFTSAFTNVLTRMISKKAVPARRLKSGELITNTNSQLGMQVSSSSTASKSGLDKLHWDKSHLTSFPRAHSQVSMQVSPSSTSSLTSSETSTWALESPCFDSDDHLDFELVSAINNIESQQGDVCFERGQDVDSYLHREIGMDGVTVDPQIQQISEKENKDSSDVSGGNDKVKLDVLLRQCVKKQKRQCVNANA